MTLPVHSVIETGLRYHQAGHYAEAEAIYRQILAVNPFEANALNLLGSLAQQTGRYELAVDLIGRAVALKPSSAMYRQNLGLALSSQGRFDEAIASFRQALAIQPDYPVAWDNLGCTLRNAGRFEAASSSHVQAIKLRPDFAWAHVRLAGALTFRRHFDQAWESMQRALELAPSDPSLHQEYLTLLQYQPSITPGRLLDAHLDYERRHAAAFASHWRPHANSPDLDRRLRLGFISRYFGLHPVGHFFVRFLENLDSSKFEIFCYSDSPAPDAMTARIKASAGVWIDSAGENDEVLASRIRADGIDILFDLAGHTYGNRLPVFARKPAPVQITWLDYVGTTGLAAMDYLVADPYEIPEGSEHWYSEKILRVPDDYICFDPPPDAPPVNPLPALRRGCVTFGSFNLLAKTSPQILEVWARILQTVPNSRLVLRNRGLSEASTCEELFREFASFGIAPERLEFFGWSPRLEALASYHDVDLALDTWPYNGGLTTCEALWMGVPVITCPGQTFAGRHGLSHLTAAGIPEFIARDFDHYVELAADWAADLPRLDALRSALRERVARSALCDGARFSSHFAASLREVWRNWVRVVS
jgi:predicted O-linked N-acetylglucosamine transferase (SPINDLY family)